MVLRRWRDFYSVVIPFGKSAGRWLRQSDPGLSKLHKIRHLTFTFLPWVKLLGSNEERWLTKGVPWITFGATHFLTGILNKRSVVFEYGSGSSTVFYARRCAWVHSVEHDPSFFSKVKEFLGKAELTNLSLNLIEPTAHSEKKHGALDPSSYTSTDEAYIGKNFYSYVTAIDAFSDNYFDVVSVDGRARPHCLKHALKKVKIGGYLLLDNSEREAYQEAMKLFTRWEKISFFGPGPLNVYFWETTLWRRLA